MRLRRRRDQEEADQDQAKILKVPYNIIKCAHTYIINYILIFSKNISIIYLAGYERHCKRKKQR